MTEDVRIEILFNSVETELDRRHAVGEVPPAFVSRPVDHIRRVVKSWWEIYHEAVSATKDQDRTTWTRNSAYPSKALDLPELIASLEEIQTLIRINLPALKQYRDGPKAEDLSIAVLQLITVYYQQLQQLATVPWKQIQ